MKKNILEVKNIWKSYTIGRQKDSYLSFRERVKTIWKPSGKAKKFWALQDINFEVEEGECIGIIGRNGAGKSTLLKILSKITPPTKGEIVARGRIASLLEVGTGFHPELTGRENIFLNGSILGLRKAEIERKFDEIVDFSGVEQFLDTPLKHYSSGMQLRLAFSVAAHLEPEILLIDEVLAVGDAEFQKKCLGKMDEVSKSGRTILFVSHNLNAVNNICTKTILMNQGVIKDFGLTKEVIGNYTQSNLGLDVEKKWDLEARPSSNGIELISARVYNLNGQLKITTLDDVNIEFIYTLSNSQLGYTHWINVYNAKGDNVFNSQDTQKKGVSSSTKGVKTYQTTCTIPKYLMNTDIYTISIVFFNPNPFEIYLWAKDVISFRVEESNKYDFTRGDFKEKFPGLLRPLLQWKTQEIG